MTDNYADGFSDRRWGTEWNGDPDPHDRAPNRPRGWGCLSWLMILSLVGMILYLRTLQQEKHVKPPPLDDTAASTQGISELQIRFIIGYAETIRQVQPGSEPEIRKMYEGGQVAALGRHGTLGQRLQFVILSGELADAKTAIELLGRLKWDWEVAKLTPDANQLAVFKTLVKAYSDYRRKKFDAPSVTDAERQLLISKLGWYGKVALTPPQAPDRVARNALMAGPQKLVFGMLGIVVTVMVVGLVGLIGLAIFGLCTMIGAIKVGLRPGTSSSGIYAETFALWMFGFMGGSLAVEFWPRPGDRFALTQIVFWGSLIALAWPVIRGIPWRQVRQDIGLSWGRSGILEPLWGIPGYAMMMPMLGIGLVFTFVLIVLSGQGGAAANVPHDPFEPQQMLSHPIVEVVLRGGFWLRVQLMLLACVGAPLVEEIMFRGVLYRHVRDATGGLGWILSCLISALWVSFIFAVIHPQGMVAVPALMGIACGCTLVREWRDSLWASMVVHGLNNGLVFTLLMFGAQ